MTTEEVVDEFIRRIVAKDIDGACELVTDDVEYDNVPMGKVYGPVGIHEILDPMAALDETDWVVHRQLVSGNLVMNERTDRFRMGNRWLELPVTGVWELNDGGRITLWRDYFDMATMTDQMAALAG